MAVKTNALWNCETASLKHQLFSSSLLSQLEKVHVAVPHRMHNSCPAYHAADPSESYHTSWILYHPALLLQTFIEWYIVVLFQARH